MDVEQAACHAHDELVYFLQVDEDASTMVKRIQSFQLKSGVPLLDQVGACRKGGAVELLCPSRCSSTLCLQTVIRFVLPSQWQGVAIQGLEGRVFYIDGDDLFDMILLLSMLTTHLEQLLPQSMHEHVHATSELVQATLNNLTLEAAVRASNSVLQLTVDSSADFVSALEQVAQLVPSQESDIPTVVIVNGVMAFYEQDCAGGLDRLFLPDQDPPLIMTLPDAHARMIAAVSELGERAAVVLFTVDAVVQMDDVTGITCRDPLPPAWEEVVTRCLAIYESASADSQQPMHLARWLLPPQDAVFMLKNEGFSSPVEDEGA